MEPFVAFLLDQIQELRPTLRVMFGGYALFNDQLMFGIIYRGVLYLKWAKGRGRDVAGIGRPFQPRPGQTLWSYREVPAEVIEDRVVLRNWVAGAIASARVMAARKSAG